MVRIRLKRMGRRNRPFYRICAMDSRAPRDGKSIEDLGWYDPMVQDEERKVYVNKERVEYWLRVGAQPTEKCRVLLKKAGVQFPPKSNRKKRRKRPDLKANAN